MLDQLTEKQREVLALVADNRTSKEIARMLGISESAVNQRVEAVRRMTGGLARAELARIWREQSGTVGIEAAIDAEVTCNPLTGQSSQLPEEPVVLDSHPAGGMPDRVASPTAPGTGSQPPANEWNSLLPAALDGSQGTSHRLVLIMVMAAAMLMLALSGLSIVETLSTVGKIHGSPPQPRRLMGG